ncbi:oxidative stress-induced growth inhibitor 2-like, partial [Mercenaria mercenaria]|uniref:oxidative stress-induced growth inhibitor 2-like n=1 Tax=Mercenaria mercenaria TaxID=6596 RepID=UPI00234FA690
LKCFHRSLPHCVLFFQELAPLCEGVEGRSSNPVAVLFDALSHPDADLGGDNHSLLDWRYEPERRINHIVLGKEKPGGSWQKMDGSMQTLSLSSWMELPDMPFKEWQIKQKRQEEQIEPCMNRATITDICNYYTAYVEEKNLKKNFHDNYTVTSVRKVFRNNKAVDCESGETEPCCPSMRKHPYYWEVRGYRLVSCYHGDGETEVEREEFCISCLSVVIATGTFDVPNKLGVVGENLPVVSHSLHEFESVINNKQLQTSPDPVLIVGAGLSAADAVLMAVQNQVPLVHVFRRGANDSTQILKKLPQNMYPEYHEVHQLMKGTKHNPFYKSMPKHDVIEIKDDMKVLLKPYKVPSAEITSLDISHTSILIGSRPDLSFLPGDGRSIGIMPKYPIESKHNPVDIDPYSYQCIQEEGLFAMGPLVGDNFVRFGLGGALGITSYLSCRNK